VSFFSLEDSYLEEVIIIGGGIAGLSCLNALIDRGVSALLLEGGTIGSNKMCGEFLSPSVKSILERWDIGPANNISNAEFCTNKTKFELQFPETAFAFSRSEAELQLAARAKLLGGRIRENTLVNFIQPKSNNSDYVFSLADEEKITAKSAIFATGRLGQKINKISLPYVGVKFYIPTVLKPASLIMHSLKNGYFGIVPLSDQESNCAGLIKKETIKQHGSFINYLKESSKTNIFLKKHLAEIDLDVIRPLEASIPSFGFKKIPNWPDAYWIGDAMASLYPAIGSGFSHSINSAIQAAEFYVCHDAVNYQKKISANLNKKIMFGKYLHYILMQPKFNYLLIPLIKKFPFIVDFLLKQIGYKLP